MSTSFQAIPPPPGAVYQAGESNPAATPYHSDGSYITVFIILAMIFAVSVVACVLNRLCEKRSSGDQPKTKKSKNDHGHERAHNKARYPNERSKERDAELGFGPKGADIEIGGFDRKIPKVKFAPNGHGHGQGPHPHGYGHGKQGQRSPQNGSGSGQYGGGPVGHHLLPMMECPRNF